MRSIRKNSADQSIVLRIVDATDGTPETAVEHDTSGIDFWYRREGAAKVSITEASLSALTDAHSDGGLEHIGDGYYRLDLPDAAVATGADGVLVGGTVTGMVVIGCYVPLVAYDPQDTVRLGLTTLPNVASGSAGAIPTVGTGAAQIALSSGQVLLDATSVRAAIGLASANLDSQLAAIDSVADSILDDTGSSGVVVAAGSKAGYALSASGLDAIIPNEPAAAPNFASSLLEHFEFWAALALNEITQSASTTTLRNNADDATIATHGVNDDGTTFTSGKAT